MAWCSVKEKHRGIFMFTCYLLDRSVGGPQSLSGRGVEEKNSHRFRSWESYPGCPARIEVTALNELSRLLRTKMKLSAPILVWTINFVEISSVVSVMQQMQCVPCSCHAFRSSVQLMHKNNRLTSYCYVWIQRSGAVCISDADPDLVLRLWTRCWPHGKHHISALGTAVRYIPQSVPLLPVCAALQLSQHISTRPRYAASGL
jgi:hypothetical protein